MWYVIYCKVVEDKELGLQIDYPFIGSARPTKEQAIESAKELVAEKRQAVIIPEVYEKTTSTSLDDIMEKAASKFNKMADNMHDAYMRQQRNKN